MKKDRTKRLLADALLTLTNIKLLSEISISDITDYCCLGRNAFYYHFKDKRELIYWIYAVFHESNSRLSPNNIHNNLIELFTYMHKYSFFFKQALSERGQNCFRDEFMHSMYKDCLHIIDSENTGIDPDLRTFAARFFANAIVETSEMLISVPTCELKKYVTSLAVVLNTCLSLTSIYVVGDHTGIVPQADNGQAGDASAS